MLLTTKFSERLTTVLSTFVAAVMLVAGVTAQQELTSRPPSIEQLESDLRFQIRSAFRMTPLQAEQRLEHVDKVMDEYRSKTRSATDQDVIADWLVESTIRSMPGSIKPLLPAPEYQTEPEARPEQEKAVQPPTVVRQKPSVKKKRAAFKPRVPTPAFGGESLLTIAPPLEIEQVREESSILKTREKVAPPAEAYDSAREVDPVSCDSTEERFCYVRRPLTRTVAKPTRDTTCQYC